MEQVGQPSQTNRGAACVSFGKNKCEKHACNIALSCSAKNISKCWTI